MLVQLHAEHWLRARSHVSLGTSGSIASIHLSSGQDHLTRKALTIRAS